jgi:hypothetical protein
MLVSWVACMSVSQSPKSSDLRHSSSPVTV